MKIAILGGSFNPVHNGHIMIAQTVVHKFGYDKVLFVPTFRPPHKVLANGASDFQRLEMLELALKDYSSFDIEICEIERKGISYSIDTVSFLEKKYFSSLEGRIGLIIGEDLIEGFPLWKDVDCLASKVDIILATRQHNANQRSELRYKHAQLKNDNYAVSSHMIRKCIQDDLEWESLVPYSVYEFIVREGLYV